MKIQSKETKACLYCKKPLGWKRKHLLEYGSFERAGRPRKSDHNEIIRLRKMGKSLSVISNELNVSRGAVQYAIKLNKDQK